MNPDGAARPLVRWYTTRTGAIYLALLVVALAAVVVGGPAIIVAIAVGAILAVAMPYKLARINGQLQGLTIQKHRLARTAERVASEHVKAVERHDRLRDDLHQLAAKHHELSDALADLSEAVAARSKAFAEFSETLASKEAEINQHLRELDKTSKDAIGILGGRIDNTAQDLSRRITQEHRLRSLSVARRDAAGATVDSIALLLCPQRVGSTWLFDLLRFHPNIGATPMAHIYRALGVRGRRYPGHLTDGPGPADDIEVQDGIGGWIPRAIPDTFPTMPRSRPASIALEKVHPSSFEFDTASFLSRLEDLRQRINGRIIPIYQIREPAASVQSFLAYKRRQPSWHADIPADQAVDLQLHSWQTLIELHRNLPGPVVAYEDLREQPAALLSALYETIDPSTPSDQTAALASEAIEAVDVRSRELRVTSKFSGSNADVPPREDLSGSQADPEAAREGLRRCEAMFETLRAQALKVSPPAI